MEQNQQLKQPNKDYINQSLVNQIADFARQVAIRDATITEIYQQIAELTKELEEYRGKEIKEMDKGGKTNAKK